MELTAAGSATPWISLSLRSRLVLAGVARACASRGNLRAACDVRNAVYVRMRGVVEHVCLVCEMQIERI